MEATTFASAETTVRLEEHEGWRELNDGGYPFWVRQVRYIGGSSVTVRGFMIKTDGTRGYNERETRISISKLPREVFIRMRISYIDSIYKLYESVKDSSLLELRSEL